MSMCRPGAILPSVSGDVVFYNFRSPGFPGLGLFAFRDKHCTESEGLPYTARADAGAKWVNSIGAHVAAWLLTAKLMTPF